MVVVVVLTGPVVVVVPGAPVVVVVCAGLVVVLVLVLEVVVAGRRVVVVVAAAPQLIAPDWQASTTPFEHCDHCLLPGEPHVAWIWSRQVLRLHGGGVPPSSPSARAFGGGAVIRRMKTPNPRSPT